MRYWNEHPEEAAEIARSGGNHHDFYPLAGSAPQASTDATEPVQAGLPPKDASPSSCSATTPEGSGKKDETGWLIEKDDTSHPKYLTICERRWDWSHDHQQAIRFFRKHDAEIIATHFLLEHAEKRIAEHAWDVSLIPVDGSPSVGGVELLDLKELARETVDKLRKMEAWSEEAKYHNYKVILAALSALPQETSHAKERPAGLTAKGQANGKMSVGEKLKNLLWNWARVLLMPEQVAEIDEIVRSMGNPIDAAIEELAQSWERRARNMEHRKISTLAELTLAQAFKDRAEELRRTARRVAQIPTDANSKAVGVGAASQAPFETSHARGSEIIMSETKPNPLAPPPTQTPREQPSEQTGDALCGREIELDAQWNRMPPVMKAGIDRASFDLGWRLGWSSCEKECLAFTTGGR